VLVTLAGRCRLSGLSPAAGGRRQAGGLSSTGAPNSRPSRTATATTGVRLVGAYGTRPNGDACASGGVAGAQAARAVTTASGGRRISSSG